MTVAQLNELLASPTPPLLIDVRRREAFLRDTQTLGGALRRDLPAGHATASPQGSAADGWRTGARRSIVLPVRAAGTGRMDLAPQAAGLLAISQGLSLNYPDDHAMLEHGLIIYDALYRWCSARVHAVQ